MPGPLRLLLASGALLVAVLVSVLPVGLEVVTPRLGIPAVVLPGETFQLELRGGLPFLAPDLVVRLVGEETTSCAVTEVSHGGATRTLEVTVPETLAAGSYTLKVESQGLERSRPKAVHVLSVLPDEGCTIVQLADLAIFGGDGSGEQLMATLVEEINLIAPDLVLVTGDINYTGSWEHFDLALEFLGGFEMPVLTCIGNHEYKGLAGFLTAFGLPRHVVDVGGRRFITLDSGHGRDQLTESQHAWVREAFATREGRDTIVQLHHPLFWKRNLEVHVGDLVELCAEHEVPIVLSGHLHGDQLFDATGTSRRDTNEFPGTKYVVTTAAGADLRPPYAASPLHHGYRLIRLEGNSVLDYTYDWPGDVDYPSCSIPVGHLRVESVGEGHVRVHNELNEALFGAVVSIAVAGPDPRRPADLGEVIAVRRSGESSTYRVRVDLPARSVTSIELIPE